jgi:D-sedoheptulose 7-phosphate isomerase
MTQSQLNKLTLLELSKLNRMVVDTIKSKKKEDSKEKRKALPAAALTTDTSILTAIGNDFGFEEIFARQINALCTSKDILIALSTSGTSVNITKAIDEALAIKLPVVLFTSIQAPYISRVHMIRVPGTNSSRIQESYMVLLHTLVEMVENE